MTKEAIMVEMVCFAPPENVWEAISKKENFSKWNMEMGDFKPEVGHEFKFILGPDDRKYTHLCKVLEVIPNEKLSYTWKYEGYDGDSTVTFQLFSVSEGKNTRVRITHEGIDTFPQENPDFAKGNFKEGWTYTLAKLKEYVEKDSK